MGEEIEIFRAIIILRGNTTTSPSAARAGSPRTPPPRQTDRQIKDAPKDVADAPASPPHPTQRGQHDTRTAFRSIRSSVRTVAYGPHPMPVDLLYRVPGSCRLRLPAASAVRMPCRPRPPPLSPRRAGTRSSGQHVHERRHVCKRDCGRFREIAGDFRSSCWGFCQLQCMA